MFEGSFDLELEGIDADMLRRAIAHDTDVVNPIHVERIVSALGLHLARRLPLRGAFRSEDRRRGDGRVEIAGVLPNEDTSVGFAAFSVHLVVVEA
jgi:hypothetical protein